jgi:hypothetical protein
MVVMLMVPQQTIPAPQAAVVVHITPLPASVPLSPLLLPLEALPSSPPSSGAASIEASVPPLLLLLLELQATAVAAAHDATNKISAFFI